VGAALDTPGVETQTSHKRNRGQARCSAFKPAHMTVHAWDGDLMGFNGGSMGFNEIQLSLIVINGR
jgi:hypothetical protein